MQVGNLARVLAGRVQMIECRVAGRFGAGEEEGEAVLLETGHAPCEDGRVAVNECEEGGAEFLVEGGGASLGYLAVGDDARDAWTRV